MKILKHLILLLGIVFIQYGYSQNNTTEKDSTYYDNWIGEWCQEIDGVVNKMPSFIVRYGLYHSSFEEYWIEAGGYFSIAWRAWDTRTKKWDFAWMSSDGLFQIWKGKKINGVWYMYNTFIIDGEEILSRQAFIPQSEKVLIRTSEHSKDNGKTWKLRFKEKYVKR